MARSEAAESGRRIERYADPPQDHREEGDNQQHAADQPPFLGHRREDEIGMAFGEVIKVALGAVQESLAEHPARADRDFRLADMVAEAERIAFGIEEDQDAVALIAVEHEIDRERRGDRRCQRAADE